MKQIKALFKLSRPLSTLSGGLAVILAGYVAGAEDWTKILLAFFATLCVSASANAWNDYLDVEIDRINQPNRPLPSGKIGLRSALTYSVVMMLLSLTAAAFINVPAFIIAVLSNILLYIYSFKLKSTVLLGNATIALISGMSAVFGGVAAGNPRPTLLLAVIIACTIMGREVLKTLADYEGDLKQRCRTIATVWGRRWARLFFFLLAALTLIVMMTPYIFKVYRPVYAYMVAFGVYPVVFYILLRVTRERTGPQLERLSQIMKYDFLVWFVAVWLGAG